MLTKEAIKAKFAAEISAYPTAAEFYRTNDPRLLAMLDSMAVMVSMLSAEQDVAAAEPFTKSRDATVLADAAVKGVLPFGSSKKVKIALNNTSAVALTVAPGRRILDPQGRQYVVDTGATVAAGGSAFVTASQKSESTFTHTVSLSQPFYTVEVPARDEGKYATGIAVSSSANGAYAYTPEFVNVSTGDKVFHLFSDENRKLYIQFGANDLAGRQPDAGAVLTVTVYECEGAFELATGSAFAFEYSNSLYEAGLVMTLDEVLSPGSSPLDAATLREVANYPSIYDTSAVYLGNFDYLLRRGNLAPFRFLSVWNEQEEEAVRGANVDNINTIFIAALKDGVAEATLREQIRAVIMKADDSYKLKFIDAVHSQVATVITAKVPAIYDFAAVKSKITERVLAEYGPDSVFAQKGQGRLLYKRVYEMLVADIQALQGETSDLQVSIADPVGGYLPEQYRYISSASLTVNVEQAE